MRGSVISVPPETGRLESRSFMLSEGSGSEEKLEKDRAGER